MRVWTFLILSLLMCSCGYHKQDLNRVGVEEEVVEAGETDPTQILINAVNKGDLEQVKTSVLEGGDVNARNNEGLTLIMVAIQSEQYAILDFLVSNGADVELRAEVEIRASVQSRPMGEVGSVEVQMVSMNAFEFLENLGLPEGKHAVMVSLLNGEEFDTKKLGADLFQAMLDHNLDLLRWLFDKGANPNFVLLNDSGKPQETPLLWVLSSKRPKDEKGFARVKELFELLTSHPGLDVNLKLSRRKMPLVYAQKRAEDNPAYQPMVDQLISMGANTDEIFYEVPPEEPEKKAPVESTPVEEISPEEVPAES